MSDPTVFVSYAHEDRQFRHALVAEIERLGIRVWTDDHLEPGRGFNEDIAHSLYRSRAVIVLSSGHSQASEYVDAEITFALKLKKTVCEVSIGGNHRADLTDRLRVDYTFGQTEWSEVARQLSPTLKKAIGPSEIFLGHGLSETSWRSGRVAEQSESSFVEWVVEGLTRGGLSLWFEPEQVRFGDDRDKKINDAIDRAGLLLAVLSETSATSSRLCWHLARALGQGDEVFTIVHRQEGTDTAQLFETWSETMEPAIVGQQNPSAVRAGFYEMQRREPVVFIGDERDPQLLSEVAEVLRQRQKEYEPDLELESRVDEVFRSFMDTARERGLDIAQVLSLPEFRVEEMDDADEPPEDGGWDPPAPAAAVATPKFCRRCGTPTTPGDVRCGGCGFDFATTGDET